MSKTDETIKNIRQVLDRGGVEPSVERSLKSKLKALEGNKKVNK